MRQRAFWMSLASILLFSLCACDEQPKQQEVIVEQKPAPVVDSLQLQVMAYEQQLIAAEEDINKAMRQLDRVSAQLQDSIAGTEVPPQLQEEMIASYQNRLHEVREVKAALRQWQERDIKPADSLTTSERKDFLEKQLEQLERLMWQSRQVRREAQSTMQEADSEDY